MLVTLSGCWTCVILFSVTSEGVSGDAFDGRLPTNELSSQHNLPVLPLGDVDLQNERMALTEQNLQQFVRTFFYKVVLRVCSRTRQKNQANVWNRCGNKLIEIVKKSSTRLCYLNNRKRVHFTTFSRWPSLYLYKKYSQRRKQCTHIWWSLRLFSYEELCISHLRVRAFLTPVPSLSYEGRGSFVKTSRELACSLKLESPWIVRVLMLFFCLLQHRQPHRSRKFWPKLLLCILPSNTW